jgi:exonuclease SbcC
MLIEQVKLENIKSYENATVDFQPGVNAIVGHNGAGKSTILEGIGFALFDSLAYKANDFLREGARTGGVAVTFTGSLDERPYRVERRLGGSHLYVAYDVELQAKLCEGKTDVLAFVRRQIGADPTIDLGRLFADAIGVPQGTLTAAFLQQPAQRKVIFDALLQVDEYRAAVDKLREPRALLGERRQAIAQEVAVLAARLERLPQLQSAVAERTIELRSLTQTLTALQERLGVVGARKQALDSVRSAVEQLEVQEARAAEAAKRVEAQVVEAQRLLAAAEEALKVVETNRPGHGLYAAAQAQRSALDQQLRQRQILREQRATADKALALAESEIARAAEQITRIDAAQALIARLAPAVQQQAEIEESLTAAKAENLRLQDEAKTLASEQKKLQQLQAREQQLSAELGQVEAKQSAAKALEEQAGALRTTITESSGELGTVQAGAGELKRQNEALELVQAATCPICEQPLSEEHRQRVLDRNNQRLQELRGQYATTKQKMTTAETSLKQVMEQHRVLTEALRSLARPSELEDLRQRIALSQQAAADAAEAISKVPELTTRMQELSAALAALQNPRQQIGVAAQQVAERPAVEARRSNSEQQRQAALHTLVELDTGLAELKGLDADITRVEASLQMHEAAFQAVLTHQRQADARPERAAALTQLQQEREQATAALEGLQVQIRKLRAEFDPAEYAGILADDLALRGEIGGMQARSTLLQDEQRKAQAEIEGLHVLESELVGLAAAQTTLGRHESVLETVRTLLRQSGPYITQALIRQISGAANQIFGELMQDFSRQLSWSEDYGITLEVESNSRQFVQLSGGEQMSAALAVRLALVREISNIDIAFFDEPTANLDDVRREALARQVMNIRGFRQLFVISHDDTFEQVTQNLIRIIRHGSSSSVAPNES